MRTAVILGRALGVGALALVASGVLSSPVSAAEPSRQVTFTKDIAPILQRSCQNCHRPNGGLAPMALTTYAEVRPWAKAIKLRTSRREMPPWFIEKNVGIQHFKDDNSLSDEEIAAIGAWADNGAPEGSAGDLPPARQFTASNAWNIGEPDLVIDSPMMTVEAVAGDFHAPYAGATSTGLTEDRWIAAFEIKEYRVSEERRAGGKAGTNNYLVLHHQLMASVSPSDLTGGGGDGASREAAMERLKGAFNYVYEVGQNAQHVPKDVGVVLKAGGKIYFHTTHLHSIGREVKFHTRIGFKFHPKGYRPKYPQGLSNGALAPPGGYGAELDIPGNTDDVRFDRFYRIDKPSRLVTFEPHLHASGKRMYAEAIYTDGRIEMLNCSGYDHAWVRAYTYDDDYAPLLPKGTILHVIAWYDNTAKNPRVADPRNWRGVGHRSIDDMFIFLSRWTVYSDEEFAAVLAEREERLKSRKTSTAPKVTTTARNDGR